MKKFLPYLVLILFFSYLYISNKSETEYIYYMNGNTKMEPLPVQEIKKDKKIFCSDCNMMVKDIRHSAQVVIPGGRTYFFNDVGCMIRWLDRREYKEKELGIFVFVSECTCYVDAEDAWYVRDGLTPLGYGVEAFGTYMEAQRSDMLLSAEDFGDENFERYSNNEKGVYEFKDIKKFVLRGETLLNPVARKIIFKGVGDEE